MADREFPKELLVENGGVYEIVENEDGTKTYVRTYKTGDPFTKGGVGQYTGAGVPGMERHEELAGFTIYDQRTGFEQIYDDGGYCVSARNLKHPMFAQKPSEEVVEAQKAEAEYREELDKKQAE